MNTAFATDNGWAKICRWTLIHVCTMCTEKEDLLTVYFWVWREGLRQQLHLLHCMQLMVEIYVSKYFEHQSIHAVKRVGKMAWKVGIHRKRWSSVLLREERWPQLTCAGVCIWMQGNCVGTPYTTILRVSIYSVWSPVYISLHVSDSLKSHLISSEAQGNIQTLWVLCLVYTHTHCCCY